MAIERVDEFAIGGNADEGQVGEHFGHAHKSSYSLLLLFYLTTAAAIMVAACRMAFTAPNWTWKAFVFGYIAAGGWLIVLAALVGYVISRKPWGIAVGVVAGLVCGLLTILMVLVQPLHYLSAALVLGAGSWALAVLAIVANRWQTSAE